MKCIKCGRNVGAGSFCTACGFDNKHIRKAVNTANYYYNAGLEKAKMHDLFGAEEMLKKALSYNKAHKDARNLLGLVYQQMGEKGKAYIQWKISENTNSVEENVARLYVDGKMIDDNFYNGRPFLYGLWRLPAGCRQLELRIIPLQENMPVYFPKEADTTPGERVVNVKVIK